MSKINKIKEIEYQLLKRMNIDSFTDQELVGFAQGILNACVDDTDSIIDSEMPTSMLGTTLDWSAGSVNDAIVRITRGDFSITQDLTADNIQLPSQAEADQTTYNTAYNLIKNINGETSVPDTGYTEVDLSTTLSDAYNLAANIEVTQRINM